MEDAHERRISPAKSVEDLEVFGLAHRLTLRIYAITRQFPREEQFGMISQLRRGASAVCANLAEGAGRLNRPEYRHFVGIAKGSVAEISYFLMLGRDLNYVSPTEYQELRGDYDRVGQMLTKLSQALRS